MFGAIIGAILAVVLLFAFTEHPIVMATVTVGLLALFLYWSSLPNPLP